MNKDFKKIQTKRGAYIIPWDDLAVHHLIEQEQIKPKDLIMQNPSELKEFIRSILLLAGQAAVKSDRTDNRNAKVISHFARELINNKYQQSINQV